MADFASNHLNQYTAYTPGLANARVISPEHRSLSNGWHGIRLITAGMLISALVMAATHIVELHSSAAPVTQSTASSASVVNQPAKTTNESTIANQSSPVTTAATATLPDSTALQAVIDKWQADYAGGRFGVVVRELDGAERRASLNSHNQFEAASLYKLFLADYIYTQVNRGNLSLQNTFGMSRTIGDCMKPLVVLSDNVCGESMGYAIGWPTLHYFVRQAGFGETIMSPVNVTTAADMAKYLEQLQAGTLIKNTTYSKQLLTNMKTQIFRSGIPAGVPGVVVADKVGFNSDRWHDAAIVYGPKSTYVLVVMSEHSSSAALKDLSKRVAEYFNQ